MARATLPGVVVVSVLLSGCLLTSAPDRAPDAVFEGEWRDESTVFDGRHPFTIEEDTDTVTMCMDGDGLTDIRYALGSAEPPTPIFGNSRTPFCKELRDEDEIVDRAWAVDITSAEGTAAYRIRVWW